MPFKNLKIEIIPESDSIQLFHDQETLRGEEYSLHGRLRLIPLIEKQTQRKKNNAPPPVSVQHIHLRLQGYIQTVLTNNIPDDEQDNTKKCKDITTLTLLDRIMYSAKGYANVTECILDQHMTVSPNLTLLTAPTDVPFTFLIERTHLLPPSMHSSTHLISYTMTAIIQEDTMLKKCEICQQQQHLLHHPYSKNCHDVFMNILKKKKRKSKIISSFNTIPLSVKCYSYASLYNLHYQPRIKYCGARPSCLQYEIHLAKYLLYDNYDLPFQCHFKPLSPSVHINRLYFYILQTEKYPYRPGHIMEPLRSEIFGIRSRKIGITEYTIDRDSDDLDNIDLRIHINPQQLSLPVTSNSLVIEHKLRLIVQFEGKIKRMALSFPVEFCALPPTTETQPRLMTSISSVTTDNDTALCKLPSYHDVMTEGAPPSPFYENMPLTIA